MRISFSVFLFLIISFHAQAQKTKLKCAKPIDPIKACSIKSKSAEELLQSSYNIKESCEKELITDDFIKAYRKLVGLNSPTILYGNYYSDIDKELESTQKYLNKLKDQLKIFELPQHKEQLKLINEYKNASKYLDSLYAAGKDKLAEKAAEKIDFLEQIYNQKYGDFSDIDITTSPKELKEEINSIEQTIKQLEIKKIKIQEIKSVSSSNDTENKEVLDKLHISLNISEEVNEIKLRSTYTDCGLSNQEIYAIILYTGSHYRKINSALRSKNESELTDLKPIIDSLNSGLSKIQSFNGMVRRGANLPSSIEDQHCLGCTVKYAAYTSSSKELGFEGSSIFVIKSKSGKYIAPLSVHAEEEEVLFAPGTEFKVLNIKKGSGHKLFTMGEK